MLSGWLKVEIYDFASTMLGFKSLYDPIFLGTSNNLCLLPLLIYIYLLVSNQIKYLVEYWCKVYFGFRTRESHNHKVEALYPVATKYISVNQPTNWYFLPTMLRAYQPLFLPLNSLSGRITNAINSSIVLFYHFCLIKLQFLQRKCLHSSELYFCIFIQIFFFLYRSHEILKWQYHNSKKFSLRMSMCVHFFEFQSAIGYQLG